MPVLFLILGAEHRRGRAISSLAPVEEVAGEGITTEKELAGDFDVGEGWQVLGAYQTAWSADANGTVLPTHYELDGNTITQVVDTTGAQFPVISDPIPLVAVGLLAVARALLPLALRSGARTLATQTIRAGVRPTIKGGYTSFSRFKADIAGSTFWSSVSKAGRILKAGSQTPETLKCGCAPATLKRNALTELGA